MIIVNSKPCTYIHPPYILHTFTKLERSESEIQEDDRETTAGLWGQNTFIGKVGTVPLFMFL